MYMDERSAALLQEVLKNPNISTQHLGEKFQLSKRQISYSLKKINEWLVENNLPIIQTKSNGHFLLDPNLSLPMVLKEDINTEKEYILTKNERKNSMLLMILASETELSTSHFTALLGVSTATVMRDIKSLQQELEQEGLETHYTRKDGYQIIGNEWKIRRKIKELILKMYYMPNGEEYLQKCISISKEEINDTRQRLEWIEEQLKYKFTDEKISLLPYIIAILLRRVKQGKTINFDFQINYNELSDTSEYRIVENLLENTQGLIEEEKLFMTLQLLSSNISSQSILTESSLPELNCVLHDFLTLIEKRALVHFKDRIELVRNLETHMKPAYYRIKYQLSIDTGISNTLPPEFQSLHYLIKDCIWPIEKFIGNTIPEGEIYYITLLIGGYLMKTGEPIHQFKPTAIILCTNGVTISKLLESILVQLFPEFHFYPTTSIRNFEKNTPTVDFVFSVVPLRVKQSSLLYIVSPSMNQEELQQLRRRVMQDMSSAPNVFIKEQDVQLKHLIHPEMTQIVDSVESWHDAISIASEPLLQKGYIQPSYIEKMKTLYPEIAPSILLKGTTLLPHARPEDGVKELGLSILVIKEGLSFNGKSIHIVVVVAPCDKSRHLQALLQLLTIASNQQMITELVRAEQPAETYLYLQEVLNNIKET